MGGSCSPQHHLREKRLFRRDYLNPLASLRLIRDAVSNGVENVAANITHQSKLTFLGAVYCCESFHALKSAKHLSRGFFCSEDPSSSIGTLLVAPFCFVRSESKLTAHTVFIGPSCYKTGSHPLFSAPAYIITP